MTITVQKDGEKTVVPPSGFVEKFSGGMRPMIVLPCGEVSAEDIQCLRDNGLCVVEAANPGNVKFVDPMPAASCRTEMENAAIKLSRILLNHSGWYDHRWNLESMNRNDFCALFVECLIVGTSLDKQTRTEKEREIFEDAKHDELRRLAREEAKAERAALKAKKAGTKTP